MDEKQQNENSSEGQSEQPVDQSGEAQAERLTQPKAEQQAEQQPDSSFGQQAEQQPGHQNEAQGQTQAGGFDLNYPTIINLLYLGSYFTGVTGIIGVILAYVWKGEPHEEWATSHYDYAIRTFWIGLVGTIVGLVLMLILIGFIILFAVAALVVVRTVMSLINAQKKQPMPKPDTWFV